MPKCCVVGCVSGSLLDSRKTLAAGERLKSSFYVPKCIIRLKKWQEAFQMGNQTLDPRSAVCELHFREGDVIKFDEILLKDGKINRIPRLRYKLADQAVPIIHIDHDDEPPPKEIPDDKTNGFIMDSLSAMTKQELISSATDQQEEFVQANEGKPQYSVSVNNYSFEELKTDLKNHHLIMPPGWTYIFQEVSVTFAYIHQFKLVIQIFCIIDQNMNVQITTFDRRATLHVDVQLRSRADIMKYLGVLSKCKCCEGTGIENSYSKYCRGFILRGDEYERSRGYQRCKPCREFRRTILLRKQDSDNLKVRVEKKQRTIKALRCTNTRLERKVYSKIL